MASLFSSILLLLLLLFIINLAPQEVSAKLVLEDGYTVLTIFNGNKLHINPRSILPRPATNDLVVLDSSSSLFYIVSSPISRHSGIKRLSGEGVAGYSDGNSDSARFDHPRSFAIDLRGNVYVADQNNHAIRKISESGVTTIAGGYSQRTGKVDGPAQNASFSSDFELTFVPDGCALLISDHGNHLIRQISLNPKDCERGSKPALGTPLMALGLGLLCLLCFVIGFAVRPYLTSCEDSGHHFLSETWKRCLINLGKRVAIICSDIKSAIAKSTLYALYGRLIGLILSYISLILRLLSIENQNCPVEPVSSLDFYGVNNNGMTKSKMFAHQLKDLIAFDGDQPTSEIMNRTVKQEDGDHERSGILTNGQVRLDNMIEANILDFVDQAKPGGSFLCSSGLVKRK